MLEALRLRDFRFLWSARLISTFGSWLLVIAVPAYVFQLTGSLTATGLTLAAEYVPVLVLGPIAGVLTDRWNRRVVMIVTDLFRAVVVSLLVLFRSPDMLWLLYLVLIAESAGTILFRPAAQAHTPVVVGTGTRLSSANSLNAFTDGTVRLVGAPLGAALLPLIGFSQLVLLDALSYLASMVAILMTARRPAPITESRTTLRQVFVDLAGGWRALSGNRVVSALLPIITVFLAANACLSAVLVPFGVTHLGGARQTGLVVSALGVGFLIGTPLIRVLVDRVQPRHLLAGSLTAIAIGFYLLFVSSSLVTALPAAVFIGVFGSMTLITPQTTLQRVLPNAVLGRVSAVFLTGEAAATLLGSLAGPIVADLAGIGTLRNAACLVTLVTAVFSYLLLPRLSVPAGSAPGQIQDFVAAHGAQGVQHIAFAVGDISRAVGVLRDRGIRFLQTPDAYYDRLAERIPAAAGELDRLRELHILVDRDQWGLLLQIFTQSVHPRGTLFLELIERRNARTFGTGNIKALYEAVERTRAIATYR